MAYVTPGGTAEELVNAIHIAEADAGGLDMEAAVELAALVAPDCSLDGNAFYQGCIEAVMFQYRPEWLLLMRQGRARFLGQLKPDAHDVFRAAGLLAEPVPSEIVSWWDAVSGHARQVSDRSEGQPGACRRVSDTRT